MGSNHNLDMYHQLEEMFARLDKMEASNASLKKENTELKAELDRVSRIADRATDQVDELMAQVLKQDDEIVALKEENTLLREDNERMKNQLNTDSSNSSKPPSSDQKRKKANEYNNRTKTGKKTGGQKGHPGKTLTKEYVQQKISSGEFDHAIIEHGKVGGNYKTRFVIDMPQKPIATEHRFYADEAGNYHIPPEFRSDVIYGDNINALIVGLHITANASVNHIVELLEDYWGITMSEGTVDHILTKCSDCSESTLNQIESYLLNSKIASTDVTFVSLNGKQTYIRNMSLDDAVLYSYQPSKSIGAIKEHTPLGKYTGTLIHDHEVASYHFGTEHAECNVHTARYLKKNTEETHNSWSKDLYAWFFQVNEDRNARINSGFSCFSDDEIKAYHEQYFAIIERGFEQNRTTKYRCVRSDEKALLNRLKKYAENHLLFISDFNVPFDNNLSERDLRKCKSHTKMSGGFRTEAGIERYCRLMSLVQTARKKCVCVLVAIINVLHGEPAF